MVVCPFSSAVFEGEELLGATGMEGTAHGARRAALRKSWSW